MGLPVTQPAPTLLLSFPLTKLPSLCWPFCPQPMPHVSAQTSVGTRTSPFFCHRPPEALLSGKAASARCDLWRPAPCAELTPGAWPLSWTPYAPPDCVLRSTVTAGGFTAGVTEAVGLTGWRASRERCPVYYMFCMFKTLNRGWEGRAEATGD